MYEKQKANLQMIRSFLPEEEADNQIYKCRILSCDPETASMKMIVSDRFPFENICLDAAYQCTIQGEEYNVTCELVVKERYINKQGNVLKTQIKNGFMKKI